MGTWATLNQNGWLLGVWTNLRIFFWQHHWGEKWPGRGAQAFCAGENIKKYNNLNILTMLQFNRQPSTGALSPSPWIVWQSITESEPPGSRRAWRHWCTGPRGRFRGRLRRGRGATRRTGQDTRPPPAPHRPDPRVRLRGKSKLRNKQTGGNRTT